MKNIISFSEKTWVEGAENTETSNISKTGNFDPTASASKSIEESKKKRINIEILNEYYMYWQ